jgi:hypothetical protein
MGYLQHPDIQTPPMETVIWRYMDLPKFLQMLEEGGLYFALLAEFTDKWEAVLGRELTGSISSYFGAASGDVIRLFQDFSKHTAVNCWHQGDGESVAMWELYTETEYGIAIKSTVGDLMKALSLYEPAVFIGSVKYEDHTSAPTQVLAHHHITPYAAILQKRTCYRHECELRVITELLPHFPENPPLGTIITHPFPAHGSVVPVHLEVLIHSITTGPRFPGWARDLLASALKRAGIHPPVVESDAFKPPTTRFIEG